MTAQTDDNDDLDSADYRRAKVLWGQALAEERERLGLNQEQLAARVGTSYQNVGHWEHGRSLPRLATYKRLLELLGPDSPVALLPHRSRSAAAYANALSGRKSPALRAGPMPIRTRAEAPLPDPIMLRSGAETQEELRGLLPEHLQGYVGVGLHSASGGAACQVDYLSPKLALEWKLTTSNWALITAERGLLQLQLAKTIMLTNGQAAPDKVMLALIVEGGALALPPAHPFYKTAAEKAGVLNVILTVCGSVRALAETIIQYEQGPTRAAPDDWGAY